MLNESKRKKKIVDNSFNKYSIYLFISFGQIVEFKIRLKYIYNIYKFDKKKTKKKLIKNGGKKVD